MKQLKINRMDFDLAFERSDDESTAYLNTETGAVVIIEDYVMSLLERYRTDNDDVDAINQAITEDDTLDELERTTLIAIVQIELSHDIEQYELIPKQDSSDGYRDMQNFILSLDDADLSERLEDAIHGRGAFRQFKNVIGRYPDAEDNWFKFKNECEHKRMMDWFHSIDIEPEFV